MVRSSNSGRNKVFFSLLQKLPAIFSGAFFRWLKLPGRELHHLPPFSTSVKKECGYTCNFFTSESTYEKQQLFSLFQTSINYNSENSDLSLCSQIVCPAFENIYSHHTCGYTRLPLCIWDVRLGWWIVTEVSRQTIGALRKDHACRLPS